MSCVQRNSSITLVFTCKITEELAALQSAFSAVCYFIYPEICLTSDPHIAKSVIDETTYVFKRSHSPKQNEL